MPQPFSPLLAMLLGFSMVQTASGAVSGRVIDASGKPVQGVTVSLERQGLTSQTDAQGRFTVGTVAIGNSGFEGRLSPAFGDLGAGFTSGSVADIPLFGWRGGAYSTQGRRHSSPTGPESLPNPAVPRSAAKTAAAEDTLALYKAAFLTSRKSVNDGDAGDITLYAAFAGTAEKYFGFDLYRFTVAGRNCLAVAPKKPRAGNPWIWRTYFWNHKPAFDSIMCSKGYYLAFMDAPNLYGAPQAVAAMDSFYNHMTARFGFSRKTNLVGVSRGAFYAYNWGRSNLAKISTLYGDGAGMDLVSWPCGCYGTGTGSAGDWTSAKNVYGFKSDAEGKAYRGNPYQNMATFAAARIPIVHVYGETDLVAPPKENVLAASDSLKAHGWQMLLLAKPNTGHVHGLGPGDGGKAGQMDSLVQFVLRNTTY